MKIKELYTWLSKRPFEKVNIFKGDTLSKSWKSYDTAINLFFNKHNLDSLFNEETEVFDPSAKLQFLKQIMNGFHDLFKRVCFENLRFKKVDSNLIDQFFLIGQEEYQVNGFGFKNQSADLIAMLKFSLTEEKSKIFKDYYDKLKPCLN